MQVKTFIYGTPLGFNFYEDDSQYKDYFKGFYISSRKGRRLMVNRLDNGETTYNFLSYGITESGNRPNAFFGMCLVLGDYQYCDDFGKLYDWFNFLFEKIVNERKLFTQQDSKLQYNVAKFEEDAEDVEWLKSNMPNILSSSEIRLQKYDASFSNKKTGKIPQFNNNEKSDVVLKAFKQYNWICLSPSFVANDDCPELDLGELSLYVDSVTQQLLPIAINPEKKHLPLLKDIFSAMTENYKSISDFVAKTQDEDSKKSFTELGQRYYEVLNNQIPLIAQKMEENPEPLTKVCARCGKNKPIEAFSQGDAVCLECRAKEKQPAETRTCSRCGREKPISAFAHGDKICIECRNKVSDTFAFPTIPIKYLYSGVAALVLVVIVVCLVTFNPFKSDSPDSGGSKGSTGSEQVVGGQGTAANNVDKSTFQNYISNEDFTGAYTYIKEKDNAEDFINQLKDYYENYLIKQELSQIQLENIRNNDLCTYLNIDTDKWNSFATDGEKIKQYLSSKTLSEADKSQCIKLINKYLEGIYQRVAESWKDQLNSIPQPSLIQQRSIQIILYNRDHQKQKEITVQNQKHIGVEFDMGGYVDIYCDTQPICIRGEFPPDPKTQTDSKRHFRIKPNERGKKWVYKIENDVEVTIQTKTFTTIK